MVHVLETTEFVIREAGGINTNTGVLGMDKSVEWVAPVFLIILLVHVVAFLALFLFAAAIVYTMYLNTRAILWHVYRMANAYVLKNTSYTY